MNESNRAALSSSAGDSASFQSWAATPTPWQWCLCMKHWGWRQWSISSTLVRKCDVENLPKQNLAQSELYALNLLLHSEDIFMETDP